MVIVIQGRSLFNFALGFLDPKFLLEKLEVVFNSVKQASNSNVVSTFVLTKEKEGVVGFQSHTKNHILGTMYTWGHKIDSSKIRNLLSNTRVLELCRKKLAKTNWDLEKLTNVTIFASLLKDVAMVFTGSVWPDAMVKNHSVKRLFFEEILGKLYNDNFCLLRSQALHLHLIEKLETETFKYSIKLWKKMVGPSVEFIEVSVLNIMRQKWTLLKQKFSCTTLTF